MNYRQIAFLEAATLCSRYADNLRTDKPEWAAVAEECSKIIAEEAFSNVKAYPPGKPVIDAGQDSENSYL